jgi:dimethylamine/trimethylamine dehydrogenase
VTAHAVTAFDEDNATLVCGYSGRQRYISCDSIVAVTSREPHEGLYAALAADPEALKGAGIASLRRIGDCEAPHIIASAVHAGHLYARTLDGVDAVKRDRVIL